MQIVSYDVSTNKVRYKIRKLLKEYGVPIQYSVFKCELSKSRLSEMVKKLNQLNSQVCKDGGTILMYEICENCMNKSLKIGNTMDCDSKYDRSPIIVI